MREGCGSSRLFGGGRSGSLQPGVWGMECSGGIRGSLGVLFPSSKVSTGECKDHISFPFAAW